MEFHPLPKDDPKRCCLDTGKVKRLVGWKPTVGFEEGLKRAIKLFVSKNAAHRLSRKNGKIRINLSDPNYAESPFPVTVFKRTNHKKYLYEFCQRHSVDDKS